MQLKLIMSTLATVQELETHSKGILNQVCMRESEEKLSIIKHWQLIIHSS
jgi:hypothetical protein